MPFFHLIDKRYSAYQNRLNSFNLAYQSISIYTLLANFFGTFLFYFHLRRLYKEIVYNCKFICLKLPSEAIP